MNELLETAKAEFNQSGRLTLDTEQRLAREGYDIESVTDWLEELAAAQRRSE